MPAKNKLPSFSYIHPWLLSVSNILFLWSQNVGTITSSEAVIPCLIFLVLTTVAIFSLKGFFGGSYEKTALFVSVL